MLSEKIGMLLKLSRISLNMQVKEIAETIGVTTATIQNIEKIDSRNIPAIIKYLLVLREKGININEMFDEINRTDET